MLVEALAAGGVCPRSIDMLREWRIRFCKLRIPGRGVFIDAGKGCGLRDGRSQHSWCQLRRNTNGPPSSWAPGPLRASLQAPEVSRRIRFYQPSCTGVAARLSCVCSRCPCCVSYRSLQTSLLLRLCEQLFRRLPLPLQLVEIILRRPSGQLLLEECDFAVQLLRFSSSSRRPCLRG